MPTYRHPSLLSAIALLLLALLVVPGPLSAQTFLGSSTIAAGNKPLALAAADLDANGTLDLVVATKDDEALAVLLNAGDGVFGSPIMIPLGGKPHGVTTADLDGDGDPDIAVSIEDDDEVTVLLNDGTGVLTIAGSHAVGDKPYGIAAADLDGDGILDLATACSGSDEVAILFGTGGGAFSAATTHPAGNKPVDLAIADLNADTIPDLAVAARDDHAAVILLGAGSGSFGPATPHPAGARPSGIAVADMNGDGIPDIVVSNEDAGTVSVLDGLGGGSFFLPVSTPVGNKPLDVAVADLDGDGDPDVVSANKDSDDLTILRNDGTGSLGAASTHPAGVEPSAVLLADLTGDGALDVACTNAASDSVTLLRSLAPGTLVLDAGPPTYEIGQTTNIVIAGEPGWAIFLLIDLFPGNYYFPGYGTIGVALSPLLEIRPLGLLPPSGQIVINDPIPCASKLDEFKIWLQAAAFDPQTFAFEALSGTDVMEMVDGDCTDDCSGGVAELGLEVALTNVLASSGTLAIEVREGSASGNVVGTYSVPIDLLVKPTLPISNGNGSVAVTRITSTGTTLRIRFTTDAIAANFNGGKLKANTWFSVGFESALAARTIHTSCSQPLPVGMEFGSFTVTHLIDVNN